MRVSCFVFSSRRRHTRCYRDWSSDVCSSDLDFGHGGAGGGLVDDAPTESGGPPKSPEPTPGHAARVDQRVANVQLVCSSGVFRSSDVLDTGVVRVSGGSHPAPLHFPPLAPPTTLQVAQIGVSSAFPTIEPPCRTTAAGLTGSPVLAVAGWIMPAQMAISRSWRPTERVDLG